MANLRDLETINTLCDISKQITNTVFGMEHVIDKNMDIITPEELSETLQLLREDLERFDNLIDIKNDPFISDDGVINRYFEYLQAINGEYYALKADLIEKRSSLNK